MKLIQLLFEGSDDEPSVSRYVLVNVADADYQDFYNTLVDSFLSYIDHVFDPENDPTAYTTMVDAVMNACGHPWMLVDCDRITL